MLALGLRSLLNRRFVSALTVLSIALSVCLILGVDRLRSEARAGFANSASGIDLVVASRGNPVQILLATVFGVGSTGNAIRWETFEAIRDMSAVDWAVPISMGDNHRGYPVIGTEVDYFDHFRHSGGEALAFRTGGVFRGAGEAVLGAEVARRFDYGQGDAIVLAHGSGDVSFHVHDDDPFTVVGVLEATGTAVDRMVLVSLQGFDALHTDRPEAGADPRDVLLRTGLNAERTERQTAGRPTAAARETAGSSQARDGHAHQDHDREPDGQADEHHHERHGDEHDHEEHDHEGHDHGEHDHEGHDHGGHDHDHRGTGAQQINAIYLGLADRTAVLGLKRYLSEYEAEPLTAVMPNVALLELWSLTGTAEAALSLMAAAVALAGILGLLAALSAALDSRRREFAVLRSVGASPARIFGLIVLEAILLTGAGLVLGYLALMAAVAVLDPLLASRYGLRLAGWWPSATEWALMGAIFVAGLVASLLPAFRVYRTTLADGLSSGH